MAEEDPGAGAGAGSGGGRSNPSSLSELEWADMVVREDLAHHHRPQPRRRFSNQQQQQQRRLSNHYQRQQRRLSNQSQTRRPSDSSSVSSARRDMYERAARETTGVAKSVSSLRRPSAAGGSASAAGTGGGDASHDDSADALDGAVMFSGTGGGDASHYDSVDALDPAVMFSESNCRLSVGSVGSLNKDEDLEDLVEKAMDESCGSVSFERTDFEEDQDDEVVKGEGKIHKENDGDGDEDDEDNQLEDFNQRLAMGDAANQTTAPSDDDSGSVGEFSLNLRKIHGRVFPWHECLDCWDCCRSAAEWVATPGRRSWLVLFVAAIAALVVVAAMPPAATGPGGRAPAAASLQVVRLPAYLEDNMADWTKQNADFSGNADADNTDVPLLWAIPLSAPALMEDIFGKCYGLVQAAEVGAEANPGGDEALSVVKLDGSSYLNIDVTTPAGLERAADLDLAGSGAADVVSTPLLHGVASTVFDSEHRGRLMVVFRHPVERIAAEFRFRKRGEFSSDRSDLADETLKEYAASDLVGDNWVTRHLVLGDDPDMDRELTELELILAKELLRRKAVVGLYADLAAAAEHFASFFGFDRASNGPEIGDAPACLKSLADDHLRRDEEDNYAPAAPPKKGGDVWNAILERNKYDVALYEFAKELYRYQLGVRSPR